LPVSSLRSECSGREYPQFYNQLPGTQGNLENKHDLLSPSYQRAGEWGVANLTPHSLEDTPSLCRDVDIRVKCKRMYA